MEPVAGKKFQSRGKPAVLGRPTPPRSVGPPGEEVTWEEEVAAEEGEGEEEGEGPMI